MKESWQNLIDLIANPRATFTRLKSNPKCGVAFFVFCFLVVVLAWIVFPFTVKFLDPQYASSLAGVELFGSTKAAAMALIAVSGIIFVDLLGIWNIFVLTVAVATLAEVSKTKACLTGVIIWLLRVGIDAIFQVGSAS